MRSVVAVPACLAVLFLARPAFAGTTDRVSVGVANVEGDALCDVYPAFSGDGRWVVFVSYADNLVPGDTNGVADVFVRDTRTGATERVSVSSAGVEADGPSVDPFISADGRYVQYTSHATNLVPGDTNGATDGFVFDRQTATTTRVTVGAGGVEGNGNSDLPVLSADARYVAFVSDATNLVAGDTNGHRDIFVRDLQLGVTTRISVTPGGGEADGDSDAPVMAANGRYVVYRSAATNLVANDTNGMDDVFRRDLVAGVTERVSVSSTGAQSFGFSESDAWAFISPDGRFVTFDNDGDDLTPGETNGSDDVYLRDMLLGTTTLVSVPATGGEGDNWSFTGAPSADGRFVTFTSYATNMVPNDTNGVIDVFVRDLKMGTTRCISVDASGNPGNGKSNTAMPTPDGRRILYWSEASDLVAADGNGVADAFVFTDTWALFQQFGTGLAGSGGAVPELEGTNGPATDGGYAIHVEDGLGGAVGLFLAGLGQVDLFPVFGGHFYVDLSAPHAAFPLALSGPLGFPGLGFVDLDGVDVNDLVGLTFYLQYLALDPGAERGVSMTNGLQITVEG
jgi:Tol biopolymer transport system component